MSLIPAFHKIYIPMEIFEKLMRMMAVYGMSMRMGVHLMALFHTAGDPDSDSILDGSQEHLNQHHQDY